jgi:hypothetical protein
MSRDAIIREVVDRDIAGEDLSESAIRQREPAFYAVACDEFGCWETVLEYAGIDPKIAVAVRSVYSRERMIRRLRRLCATGYDLNARANRARDPALYRAVMHYHGSWRAGLTAAGINVAHIARRRGKQLDEETMTLWLQQRHAAGKSLVWTKACLDNRDIALAIRQHFGNWVRALEAAGLAEPR